MGPGTLTKVLHDFLTTVNGELSLRKGEHFLVHKVIDKHWYYGQSNGKMGKFPANHLHKVNIPQTEDTESIFVSINAFSGDQVGDLSFSQGEIIIGTHEVSPGWYSGHIQTRSGIFPKTHVWQLDSTLIKNAACKKSVQKKATVKTTLKAQLKEELDLTEGDIVTITEILDDGWCRGVTADGREGIFPEGFVSFIEDSISNEVATSQEFGNYPSSSTAVEKEVIHEDVGNSVPSYLNEPAPSYYDLFPQYLPQSSQNTEESLTDNNINTLDVKPYAITLYPFNAQFPNELSFESGQVIHLLRHIDSEWVEGTIDDKKGIFPTSYVNIIVNCPDVSNKEPLESQGTSSNEQNILLPGTSLRVEYTFKAQMDGDLNVAEGDVVTVVEMANEDWVNVRDKNGQVGLCPRGYVVPVTDLPCEDTNELFHDALEDFVVIRNEDINPEKNIEIEPKRLSQPHRPAPPAPTPGRVPLPVDSATNEVRLVENVTHNLSTDIKQKKSDQRQNVISELVITEKEYVRDLKLMYETFNLHDPNFLESRGVDVHTLFGNILEVIAVAEELLDMILRAMKGCDEEIQTIGPCFLKMADKLQSAYVKYCGNHEAALALLKKYENNQEIMSVFNKGIETLRRQVACFDMSSVLIKPVQRILKYPLMLYELIKCTEDDHPDKREIEEAWKAMTDVASYINEWKRRRDIVSKYLDNDNTFIGKMAKLNMHSVAKKSARLSTKLSASLGITNVAIDSEFEELEKQFKSVEKCTLHLAKDVEQSISFLSEEALTAEIVSNFLILYYQGTPNNEITKLRDTRSLIWSQFVQDTKSCIERRVLAPVNFLMTLLEGPAMLITKRHDKLLDYDAAISKSEKYKDSRIVQEELSAAKSNYEALNQQLIEEIPPLVDAATKILESCISAFAAARKLLSGRITKHYLTLCENTTHLSPQDVLESFLVNHNLLLNQITRFSFAGMNPRIEEDQAKWCPQSERQRTLLKNKYRVDQLYVVLENIPSTSSVDISASEGSLVAVMKKQDPMGNTLKWFVDDGVMKGFLPSQKLRPFDLMQADDNISRNITDRSTLPRYASSRSNTPDSAVHRNSTPDLMSLDSPEKEVKRTSTSSIQELLTLNFDQESNANLQYANLDELPQPQRYQNLNTFYYAMYDFPGNMPGTLSVTYGQALKLVKPHDEKGNKEWWLMQNRDGQTGYVPHNYLSPTSLVRR